MAEIREKKNYGPQGLADIRKLKDVWRIHFKDGDTYDFPIDALPKTIAQGNYIVSLSSDKGRILGLKAPAGQYIWQFKQIGNRVRGANGKDGLPSSKIQRGGPRNFGDKHWIQPDEIVWVAEIEILSGLETNGIYGGLTTTINLPYSFSRPISGEVTDYADTKRNLKLLEDFFRAATGKTIMDIDIPYSDNSTKLLLRYEKFLLENQKPFLATSNDKGYIGKDTLSSVPVELLPKKRKAKAKK